MTEILNAFATEIVIPMGVIAVGILVFPMIISGVILLWLLIYAVPQLVFNVFGETEEKKRSFRRNIERKV